MAASSVSGRSLCEQTVVFLGAGSAGCGIAEHIVQQMVAEGLSEVEARARIFMVDRFGLLTDDQANLPPFQRQLSQPRTIVESWGVESEKMTLMDVVCHAHPTVLIGVTGQPGLFSEAIIRGMYKYCKLPIIMPLSNPTSRVEARPEDIIEWTEGNAIVATGSPFNPVIYKGKEYPVAQCNNVYIFPGIGLGCLASRATRITENMLITASRTLASFSPMKSNKDSPLLPDINNIQEVTKAIAFSVGIAAQRDGVAIRIPEESLLRKIDEIFWHPQYRQYRRTSY